MGRPYSDDTVVFFWLRIPNRIIRLIIFPLSKLFDRRINGLRPNLHNKGEDRRGRNGHVVGGFFRLVTLEIFRKLVKRHWNVNPILFSVESHYFLIRVNEGDGGEVSRSSSGGIIEKFPSLLSWFYRSSSSPTVKFPYFTYHKLHLLLFYIK